MWPRAVQRTFGQRNLLTSHQAAGGLTSPINGVVTRWRVRAGFDSPSIKLRVIRPGSDLGPATGAGTGPPTNPPANTTMTFLLSPALPIKVNDGVGIDTGMDFGEATGQYFNSEGGVGQDNEWFPLLADGAPPRSPTIGAHTELLLQAVIEADRDGDGLGDESQDPDGGDPGVAAFSATPASVSFANQRVGTTSPARQVTVSNSGTAALSIASVALAGANPGDYVITSNGCGGQTLAPAPPAA